MISPFWFGGDISKQIRSTPIKESTLKQRASQINRYKRGRKSRRPCLCIYSKTSAPYSDFKPADLHNNSSLHNLNIAHALIIKADRTIRSQTAPQTMLLPVRRGIDCRSARPIHSHYFICAASLKRRSSRQTCWSSLFISPPTMQKGILGGGDKCINEMDSGQRDAHQSG